jgi:phospholipid/cholesterol/gamma-HCH transport system permease protein
MNIALLLQGTSQKGKLLEFLKVLLMQIYFTFYQAIPLMSVLGIGTGLALSFQARMGLSMLGGNEQLGQILVIILFREAAPLISSLMIITRSVTAVASELATMKVNREIDALAMMGIDVNAYLLRPRIMAGNISLFLMSFTFTLFSIAGAWLGANLNSYFPLGQFISSMGQSISFVDFIFFFLKTNLIGYIVFRMACTRALSLRSGPFEVPIVTNKAVVDGLFAAIALQIVFSTSFYLIVGIHL